MPACYYIKNKARHMIFSLQLGYMIFSLQLGQIIKALGTIAWDNCQGQLPGIIALSYRMHNKMCNKKRQKLFWSQTGKHFLWDVSDRSTNTLTNTFIQTFCRLRFRRVFSKLEQSKQIIMEVYRKLILQYSKFCFLNLSLIRNSHEEKNT